MRDLKLMHIMGANIGKTSQRYDFRTYGHIKMDSIV